MSADPFLDLIRRLDAEPRSSAELAPPVFAAPARAARKLGWPLCTGCGRGVEPGVVVRWRGLPFHPSCAGIQVLALRRAA